MTGRKLENSESLDTPKEYPERVTGLKIIKENLTR